MQFKLEPCSWGGLGLLTRIPPASPVLVDASKVPAASLMKHNKKCSDTSPGSRTLQENGYKYLGRGKGGKRERRVWQRGEREREGWRKGERERGRVAERREGRREGERLEGKQRPGGEGLLSYKPTQ